MSHFKTGDAVFITYQQRTVEGEVILASENGRSLIVEFDAMLGGHVCRMPILQDEAGIYRDIIAHKEATLTLRSDHQDTEPAP